MPRKLEQFNPEPGDVMVIDEPAPKAEKKPAAPKRRLRAPKRIEKDWVVPVIGEPIMVIPKEEMRAPEPLPEENEREELVNPSVERNPKPIMVIPEKEMKSAPPPSEEDLEKIAKMGQLRNILKSREEESFAAQRRRPSPESSTVVLEGSRKANVFSKITGIMRKTSRKLVELFSYRPKPPKRPDLN